MPLAAVARFFRFLYVTLASSLSRIVARLGIPVSRCLYGGGVLLTLQVLVR
jgi:hypothetical protein